VYDPFSGRGTTVIEAALKGRHVAGNDVNPLSRILTEPRLAPPDMAALAGRLAELDALSAGGRAEIDLSMFYHPETEARIVALRRYLLEREASGRLDDLDTWIRMVATNRLTGHSNGFFSVYTLPPNQAVSQEGQLRINARRTSNRPCVMWLPLS
jgi:phosphopantothenate synthetase